MTEVELKERVSLLGRDSRGAQLYWEMWLLGRHLRPLNAQKAAIISRLFSTNR